MIIFFLGVRNLEREHVPEKYFLCPPANGGGLGDVHLPGQARGRELKVGAIKSREQTESAVTGQ